MSIVLYDEPAIRQALLPFSYTRPVSEIRVGILTIGEKWQLYFDTPVSYLTAQYLQQKFKFKWAGENLIINGSICPDIHLKEHIDGLLTAQCLIQDDTFIACKCPEEQLVLNDGVIDFSAFETVEYHEHINQIANPWFIFQYNSQEIKKDFKLLTKGRKSHKIDDPHAVLYGEENIFAEEGVRVKAAILNAEDGPIYLGKNSIVHEGAVIKGPFVLGENSQLNMAARMRGDTTIGPNCKVGGEVSNSVLFGHSNKSHDGFLGNSVIGEWCNIGADTNCSNLKNNYGQVRVWDYTRDKFAPTGLQFCGLMMGDHSKSGINTMFNTGTMVGVCANVFGAGFPKSFIPSFAWGGASGFSTYDINKAFEAVRAMMGRRDMELTEDDKLILEEVFNQSSKYRTWNKS